MKEINKAIETAKGLEKELFDIFGPIAETLVSPISIMLEQEKAKAVAASLTEKDLEAIAKKEQKAVEKLILEAKKRTEARKKRGQAPVEAEEKE